MSESQKKMPALQHILLSPVEVIRTRIELAIKLYLESIDESGKPGVLPHEADRMAILFIAQASSQDALDEVDAAAGDYQATRRELFALTADIMARLRKERSWSTAREARIYAAEFGLAKKTPEDA